jgi:hypothetical protein
MLDSPLRFFTHDRLDLVVKYRFFQMLMRGPELWEVREMYRRHIFARTGGIEPGNSTKTNLDLYLTAARVLFERMVLMGYDRSEPIPVDQWGRLRDGAHRVACAAVLGLQVEIFEVKAQFPIRQWGIDWFLVSGFSKSYVNGLLDQLNVITGYSGIQTGIDNSKLRSRPVIRG